ncbi:MAG TPA: hypothetical protein VFR34_12875 [Paracoccaceae bacterium]|nr:hypothetical protein [Paracoccaceae bacterium]
MPLSRLQHSAALLACFGLVACAQPLPQNGPGPATRQTYATPASSDAACAAERDRYHAAVRQAQATEQIYAFGSIVAQAALMSGIGSRLGIFGSLAVSQFATQMSQLQQGLRNDHARIAAYNAALQDLTDCRVAESRRLSREVEQGQVARAEAEARAAALRRSQIEDVQVARQTNAVIEDRSAKFESEVAQARTRSEQEGTHSAEVVAAEQSLQTNQAELQRTEQTTAVAESRVTELEISFLGLPGRPRTRFA